MLLSLGLVLSMTVGGFVADVPRAATLIDRELLAQVAPPPPGAMATPGLEALQAQLEQLKANEPGIGGPIVLLVTGVVAALGGLVFSYIGLLFLALTASPAMLIPALLVLVAGIGMTVGGGVWLGSALRAKNRHRRDVRALEQQIEQLERPQPELAPPPMPPPSVQGPAPTLLLATF